MELKVEELTTVTIPIPLPFQRNFGVHATTHHSAERKMQRYTKAQWDEIELAAAQLQITASAFVKESAYNMAKAINLMKKEKDNDAEQHDLRSG